MSPAQFHDQKPPKREIVGNSRCPSPPLKITKDSHFIKKSSPPHSSTAAARPQQRHPVIIYTHSPKVIHTHPRDFMALVQKLTGLSRSDEDPAPRPRKEPAGAGEAPEQEASGKHRPSGAATDDTESSSVITEENCSGSAVADVQINSCYAPPPPPTAAIYDPCFENIPWFNSSEFLPFNYNNYAESLYLVPTMRSSVSSSSSFEGIKEHRDY